MHLDEYLILWNFWKSDRKRKRKGPCACWARTAAAQQAQPERRPSALVHARAPGLNLTGGAQALARERERGDGGERLTDGACLSSLTPSLGGWRAHRRRCRARRGRARAWLGSASCRRLGGGGCGRRGGLVRRRRGLAAERLWASMAPAVFGCKRGGEEGGNGQG